MSTASACAHSLTIGPVEVSPGLLLAPMEDVTDLPFRLICKRLGADIVYTEFVNAEGLIREPETGVRRTRRKMRFLPEERPVGIQLYGAAPGSMEHAARIAAAENPDLIDINCGCWVKDVALRGAGAGLLRDLGAMREVVRSVLGATDLPVTVKTRLGWDAASIRIVDVARMLEDLGVRALSIHCRTRAQGHKGTVDYSWIPRVRAAVRMPIILNGDVIRAEDVARAFADTGCDGVMIGRGAIRHPWVFAEARPLLAGQGVPEPPSLAQRVDLCMDHLGLALDHGSERYALTSMRRHYAGYFRGLAGAAALRQRLSQHDELSALTDDLLAIRGADAPQLSDPGC